MGSPPPADRDQSSPSTSPTTVFSLVIVFVFPKRSFSRNFRGRIIIPTVLFCSNLNPIQVYWFSDIPAHPHITHIYIYSIFTMPREYHAHEIFHVNTEFRVLICQKCQYGVRPGHIESHLRGTAHRIPVTWAWYIKNIVQQWDHIDNEPEVDIWPRQIDQPIPELPIYNDGILCRQYQVYICRQTRTIKGH